MLRRKKQRTVYRYPLRFNESQLDVASRLLASTGITSLGPLVHFALAQLAKTAVGAPVGASQTSSDATTPASDPDHKLDF